MEAFVKVTTSLHPWLESVISIPHDAYKGSLAAELKSTEFPAPEKPRAGALVDCNPNGDWERGFVQDDKDDSLLVTFTGTWGGVTNWVAAHHCRYHDPAWLWEAGPFLYEYKLANEYLHPYQLYSEFHYAMKSLAEEFPDSPPALFTYKTFVYNPVKEGVKEEGMVRIYEADTDLRVQSFFRRNHPESSRVYHQVLWEVTKLVHEKYSLFQLYKDNPVAASVFPATYSTVQEALRDSSDDNELLFIKDSAADLGLGIKVRRRSDLEKETDAEIGSVVIQKAVTDLLTIDDPPDGVLFGRRFDLRFFFVVVHGRVFLHTCGFAFWSATTKPYDPNDPSTENQVPKVRHYSADAENYKRDMLIMPNTPWPKETSFQRASSRTEFDPLAWREEIAVSLSKARSTLAPILETTATDPHAYQLFGGDAMILRTTGEAIFPEFNALPAFGSFDEKQSACDDQSSCTWRFIWPQNGSHYTVTGGSRDTIMAKAAVLAELLRDTASLVIGLEKSRDLERFREIKEWAAESSSDHATETDEL